MRARALSPAVLLLLLTATPAPAQQLTVPDWMRSTARDLPPEVFQRPITSDTEDAPVPTPTPAPAEAVAAAGAPVPAQAAAPAVSTRSGSPRAVSRRPGQPGRRHVRPAATAGPATGASSSRHTPPDSQIY